MNELPHVDVSRCTGSADCVAVCPTECLAMNGKVPWLPRPLDCIQCDLCVAICPVEAIRLEKPNLT